MLAILGSWYNKSLHYVQALCLTILDIQCVNYIPRYALTYQNICIQVCNWITKTKEGHTAIWPIHACSSQAHLNPEILVVCRYPSPISDVTFLDTRAYPGSQDSVISRSQRAWLGHPTQRRYVIGTQVYCLQGSYVDTVVSDRVTVWISSSLSRATGNLELPYVVRRLAWAGRSRPIIQKIHRSLIFLVCLTRHCHTSDLAFT